MTVLKAEHLKVIEVDNVDGTSVVSQEILFNSSHANNPSSSFNNGTFDRLRDICVAPDGRVFLATNGPSWGTSLTWQNSIVELKNSSYSPTSINEPAAVVRTQIYPNPSSGRFTLVFDEDLVGSSFGVFDQVGKLVYQGSVYKQRFELDLAPLASGLYVLKAFNTNKVTSQRIIISE